MIMMNEDWDLAKSTCWRVYICRCILLDVDLELMYDQWIKSMPGVIKCDIHTYTHTHEDIAKCACWCVQICIFIFFDVDLELTYDQRIESMLGVTKYNIHTYIHKCMYVCVCVYA